MYVDIAKMFVAVYTVHVLMTLVSMYIVPLVVVVKLFLSLVLSFCQ